MSVEGVRSRIAAVVWRDSWSRGARHGGVRVVGDEFVDVGRPIRSRRRRRARLASASGSSTTSSTSSDGRRRLGADGDRDASRGGVPDDVGRRPPRRRSLPAVGLGQRPVIAGAAGEPGRLQRLGRPADARRARRSAGRAPAPSGRTAAGYGARAGRDNRAGGRDDVAPAGVLADPGDRRNGERGEHRAGRCAGVPALQRRPGGDAAEPRQGLCGGQSSAGAGRRTSAVARSDSRTRPAWRGSVLRRAVRIQRTGSCCTSPRRPSRRPTWPRARCRRLSRICARQC